LDDRILQKYFEKHVLEEDEVGYDSVMDL